MPTKIAWTDESWNPITGCTPVSEGCAHCYAKRMTERFGGDFSKVTLHPDRLEIPLRWRKPRMVFTPSMGDLFHEDVPDEFIDKVFGVMALAQRHTFQVLTKRPERMCSYIAAEERPVHFHDGSLSPKPASTATKALWAAQNAGHALYGDDMEWPLPNVWLMVSAENQKAADERLPILMETPAAVRGVSLEPLLGPLNLACLHTGPGDTWLDSLIGEWYGDDATEAAEQRSPALDWVIVGGESGGPPERQLVERCDWECALFERQGRPRGHCVNRWHPKPKALKRVRSILRQAQDAEVPCFFKQWGPRAGQGTLVDGREHREMPR